MVTIRKFWEWLIGPDDGEISSEDDYEMQVWQEKHA